MLRHDDGTPLTVKQACDAAWDQFGPAEILQELAARIGWNAKFMPAIHHEQVAKDATALAMIGERFERIWQEMETL